jgi:hypothetical protein
MRAVDPEVLASFHTETVGNLDIGGGTEREG